MTTIDKPTDLSIEDVDQAGESASVEAADFRLDRVLTITLGHTIQDMYSSFLAPFLPLLISNLSLSMTNAGLLAVFTRAPSLFQPVIGRLADRVNLRYFFILAPAVTATMMSLLGIAPSYVVLVVLLIGAGISTAALHAVGPVMAGRVSGDNVGRGMGFWTVGGELGKTLGPLLVVNGVTYLTLRGTPLLMLGGWLTSLVLFLQLRKVPGRPPERRAQGSWWPAFMSMRRVLLPVVGIGIASSLMDAALTIYLPTFLTGEGIDLRFAGASLSILQVAGVLGAFSGGFLSDRLGRRMVIGFALLSTPLFLFLFLQVSGWLQAVVIACMGFALLSIQPVAMAIVYENFPENRAFANGIYMALGFGISSVSALVLGALGDSFGLRQAFFVGGVMMLVGFPLVFLLPAGKPASSVG
jgi:FSR family fosmidomycin resistance protein-like MFS transporter